MPLPYEKAYIRTRGNAPPLRKGLYSDSGQCPSPRKRVRNTHPEKECKYGVLLPKITQAPGI